MLHLRSHRTFTAAFIAAVSSLVCVTDAWAVNPANWSFSLETTGGADSWTSDTAVDTGYPQYQVTYEITQFVIGTNLGEIDAITTGIIDAEDLTGSVTEGGLPVVLIDDAIADDDGNHAQLALGIDASGWGYGSISDVTFGTVMGIFDVESLFISGTITVTALPEPTSAALLAAAGVAILRRRQRGQGTLARR